jgi:hypothetical protein
VLFESKKLRDRDLPAFIEKYLKQREVSIDPKSTQLIADAIGTDLSRLTGELDKVILSLPETDSGFFPSIHYSKTINEIEESGSLMLDLQYNRSELDHRIPFSLLSLLFQADYPCTWPVRNSTLFSGKILQKGVLLPEINLDLSLSAEPDGSFRFTAYQTDSETQKETELLTVSGSAVPVNSSPIPKYTLDWAVQYLNIFSINDQNIGSFFSNVARSSFKGLLAFAAEVPASAFRSILDDLTDY